MNVCFCFKPLCSSLSFPRRSASSALLLGAHGDMGGEGTKGNTRLSSEATSRAMGLSCKEGKGNAFREIAVLGGDSKAEDFLIWTPDSRRERRSFCGRVAGDVNGVGEGLCRVEESCMFRRSAVTEMVGNEKDRQVPTVTISSCSESRFFEVEEYRRT